MAVICNTVLNYLTLLKHLFLKFRQMINCTIWT